MIQSFNNFRPQLAEDVFIAPSADVIGEVVIGKNSSIWYQCVIRGDVHSITIGEKTNIQDHTLVHVTGRSSQKPAQTIIGNEVTVGHRVILHGCQVEDRSLIGMGAIILDRAVIGEGSIIAAGSLIPPGKKIPKRSLVMGSPGKIIRQVTDQDYQANQNLAHHYAKLSLTYLKEDGSIK